MKTKPKQLKILDTTYTIEYLDKPSDVDSHKTESLWGQIGHWTRTIRIYDNGRSSEDIWRTIWHEVLHGIVLQLKVDWKEDPDEDIIDQLALGINCVCFDNGILKPGKGKKKQKGATP